MIVRTVSEFTNGLAKWFENQAAFRGAAISGEVSGLKETTGGHVSFTLKDRGAVLNCIVWQSKARALPALQNGSAVVATGDVRLQPDRSSYQMIVDVVQLTGVGELYAKFEQLKEQFRLEGLFSPERKRKIPPYARHVALISAQGSKASEDFLQTMRQKVPFIKIDFLATRVQGGGADVDIRDAFDRAEKLDVDVIVLTRGGGSYEDLFTFNEEAVVRAIARSRHPVITAIGHQEDHHLADDVADATYGTPSKAAEAIAQAWVITRDRITRASRDLERAIETALGTRGQSITLRRSRLDGLVGSRVAAAQRRLVELDRHLSARSPAAALGRVAQSFAGSRARLDSLATRLVADARLRVQGRETRLRDLDPSAPLQRGYALVMRGGKLLRSATEVAPGEAIEARLGHGTLDARVEAVHNE
jgi:exodeoxyribonuclease VII large subunit